MSCLEREYFTSLELFGGQIVREKNIKFSFVSADLAGRLFMIGEPIVYDRRSSLHDSLKFHFPRAKEHFLPCI